MTPDARSPRTAAGRAMLAAITQLSADLSAAIPGKPLDVGATSRAILAIEAEAATPEPGRCPERCLGRLGHEGFHQTSDYSAIRAEAQAAPPDALREMAADWRYSDDMIGKAFRAAPASPSAAPATLPADDTRIVWKRDHGMVIVTGDEEPQSLEIPAWAVRTIFDVAGKDPEEEARKVSAFINAHTGLDVERLARALHEWAEGDRDTCFIGGQSTRTPWHSCDQNAAAIAAAYSAEGEE